MRKSPSEKNPNIVEGDEEYNHSFFEPSGLVSDPIPHTARPSKALTGEDERRFKDLRDEVLGSQPVNPLSSSDIPDMDADSAELRCDEAGTGVIMMDAGDSELEAEGFAFSGLSFRGSPDAESTSSFKAVGAEASVHEDERKETVEDDGSRATRVVPRGQAGTEPYQDDADAVAKVDDTPVEEVPLVVDPWLQDVIDEQQKRAKKKQEFSKYQGHFARLNDFAVPGARGVTTSIPAKEPPEPEPITPEQAQKQAEADRSRFVEADDEGVDDVKPRELLSANMYDDLINWSSRLARETPLFNRAFGAGNTVSVCDVGCGSGRHCLMFAQWGMRVLGIDSSPSMLKQAQKTTAEAAEDIEEAKGSVKFKKGNLGQIAELVGPERTEAIVCVGDVLPRVQSLTALRETLSDFADALLPSGILVLEFTNHTHYLQNRIRTTTPVVFDTVEGTRVFLSVLDYPAGSVMVDTEMLSLTHGKDGRWKARSEHVMNFFISPDGIERELLAAGFDILEMAGNFNGKPLAPLQDESIVVIARRKRHLPSRRKEVVL